jgi:hypothetical protein
MDDKICTVPTELNYLLYFFGGLKPAATILNVPLGLFLPFQPLIGIEY